MPQKAGLTPDEIAATSEHIAAVSQARHEASKPQSTPPQPQPPHEVAERGEFVDLTEHHQALVEALGYLAGASKRGGLKKARDIAPTHRRRLIQEQGGATALDGLIEGTEFNRAKDNEKAYEAFSAAFGTQKMVQGGRSPEQAGSETRAYYQKFLERYEGAEHHRALRRDRAMFERTPAIVKGEQRLYKPKRNNPSEELVLPISLPKQPELADTELNKTEKLNLAKVARDAGFIPKTYREGTQVRALVDWAGKPNGVMRHLQETHDHLVKLFNGREIRDDDGLLIHTVTFPEAKAMGQDGRRSKVMEYVNFRFNAHQQLENLRNLMDFIDKCPNPKATLAEELLEAGLPHVIAAPLIRFAHVQAVAAELEPGTQFDPLRTTEDRSADQPVSNQNKVVEDLYTARELDPEVRAVIDDWLATTTVGQSRQIVRQAVLDEANRARFWDRIQDGLMGKEKLRAERAWAEYHEPSKAS